MIKKTTDRKKVLENSSIETVLHFQLRVDVPNAVNNVLNDCVDTFFCVDAFSCDFYLKSLVERKCLGKTPTPGNSEIPG